MKRQPYEVQAMPDSGTDTDEAGEEEEDDDDDDDDDDDSASEDDFLDDHIGH